MGLIPVSAGTAMAFYMEMYEYGILNKERCDGLELCFGNADAAFEVLHRIANGDKGEARSRLPRKERDEWKDWINQHGWGDKQLIEDAGMESKGLRILRVRRHQRIFGDARRIRAT